MPRKVAGHRCCLSAYLSSICFPFGPAGGEIRSDTAATILPGRIHTGLTAVLRDERAFNGLALLAIGDGTERPGDLNMAPGFLAARERWSSEMASEPSLLTQPSHECVRALSAPPSERTKSPTPVASDADVEQRLLILRAESIDSGRRRDGARDDGLVEPLPWSPSHPSPLFVRWLFHIALPLLAIISAT